MSSMSTTATPKSLNVRVLQEGYGAEAWHGPELKAALADVSPEVAFLATGGGPSQYRRDCAASRVYRTCGPRPLVGEHRAKHSRSRARTGSCNPVRAACRGRQSSRSLTSSSVTSPRFVDDIEAGRARASSTRLSEAERFALVLGITCHAVYHAGQVQLIKKLHARD